MLDRFQKSNNPLSKKFESADTYAVDYSGKGVIDAPVRSIQETMTLSGTINKTLVLLMITIGAAFASTLYASQGLMIGSMLGAFVLALVVSFKPTLSPILAPIYAFVEGTFLGIISLIYAVQFDGIVFQAIGLTLATLFVMLMIYRSGIIPVTKKFRTVIITATMGIMLMYLAVFVMNYLLGMNVAFLHDGGPLAIGISLFIIGIAALSFLLDFDMIEKGVHSGAPKYMEWFGGFALLVTIAWLYFEFLRLLAMFYSND